MILNTFDFLQRCFTEPEWAYLKETHFYTDMPVKCDFKSIEELVLKGSEFLDKNYTPQWIPAAASSKEPPPKMSF
ncbi:MAG: hypothetical protein ACO1QB_02590 [Verrucomicrobiales bacterium]